MSALPRPPDFKTLFESAPGLYLVLDLEMRIVALTDAYARATRTRREEILGRVVFEAFPDNPDDPGNAIGQTMAASFERVLRDRTHDAMPVLRYDLRQRAAAGGAVEQRHWSPVNYPILAADGSVSGYIHSIVDVTELHRSETATQEQTRLNETLRDSRRAALNLMEDAIAARQQAEQVSAALRASERNERQRAAELAVLMDGTPLPIFIVHDPDGSHITGNLAADKLLRIARGAEASLLAPNEIKPGHLTGVKDGREVTNEEWFALVAGRGLPVRDFDFSIVFDDGTSRDVLGYSAPLRNEDGQPRGAIVVLVDITERNQLEQSVKYNEARLRGILNSAMDAIITIDASQRVVLFNPAAERIFGYSAEQALGAPLQQFIPERIPVLPAEHVQHVYENGSATSGMELQRVNLSGMRRSGAGFPLEATIALMEEEGVKLYTLILRDITERKRVETALLRLRTDLREFASQVQSEREQEKTFLARELHDELGQALTALKMDVTWVLEKLSAGQETLVEKLEKMLLLLNGTVAAMRRISANLRPLMLDDLGIMAAADWLVGNFRERSSTECRLSITDPAFHLAEPYATAVFRILQEALTNIAKHAGASQVEISIGEINGEVRLSIADNGLGFSVTDPRKSDSFGLMGVRERVYMLNGSVDIDSAPGHGTVINVRIPIPQSGVPT